MAELNRSLSVTPVNRKRTLASAGLAVGTPPVFTPASRCVAALAAVELKRAHKQHAGSPEASREPSKGETTSTAACGARAPRRCPTGVRAAREEARAASCAPSHAAHGADRWPNEPLLDVLRQHLVVNLSDRHVAHFDKTRLFGVDAFFLNARLINPAAGSHGDLATVSGHSAARGLDARRPTHIAARTPALYASVNSELAVWSAAVANLSPSRRGRPRILPKGGCLNRPPE
jgi:hypothetical protein